MKGKLCVRLATSSRLIFCLQDFVGCFYFAGESLKFITSHLHTDERKDFLCNYSSLISVKWKKGEYRTVSRTSAIAYREVSECK